MSWIDKLAKTYDLNAGSSGLTPLFHMEKKSELIVTLDESGTFLDAVIIADKKDRSAFIPCTEDSSSRTSTAVHPHGLSDTVSYLAGDLVQYIDWRTFEKNADKAQKGLENAFQQYMAQLKGWVDFDPDNSLIRPVYEYLNRKSLCGDLIRKGIFPADADGHIIPEKPKKIPDEMKEFFAHPVYSAVTGSIIKAVVLFEIYRKGQTSVQLWKDRSVQESWQRYYLSSVDAGAESGFCQALGRQLPLARLHPKGISRASLNSKLISANDTSEFTFRGRFDTAQQASAISIEASQKAHYALRWLLDKQGMYEGGMAMVAWAVDDDPSAPPPAVSSDELYGDPFAEVKAEDPLPDTAEAAAKALNHLAAGYSGKLNAKGLCFMVLDSATPGTLAVQIFRDLEGSLYLKNILHWHTECAWKLFYGKDKQFYGAPSPHDIIHAAYGDMRADDKRWESVIRILPCILDAAPIPRDIVDCVVRRVSHPAPEDKNFYRNLGIACAVYRYANQRRKYTMALDRSLKSRDYLYGRLLAVADYLEYSVLNDSEAKRPTNAMRLMAHFADHPCSTWRNLMGLLNSYKNRLAVSKPQLLGFLESEFGQICSSFDPADFNSDRPLAGEFLLGYYCEKALFFTKKADRPAEAGKAEENNSEQEQFKF